MRALRIIVRAAAVTLFFTSCALLISSYWLGANFGSVTFEQILFHLITPLKGADQSFIDSYLQYLGIAAAISAVYALLLFGSARRRQKGVYFFVLSLSLPAALLSGFYVERSHGVMAYLTRPLSTLIEDEYMRVTPGQVEFGPRRHNLILILMESLEETYNQPEVFAKPLMPELARLRRENLSFYGHTQFPGSSWTITAHSAYLSGLPVKLPIDGNSYDGRIFASFLPGMISILELLEGNGYKIDLFMGSDAAYSGKDNLMKTHAYNPGIHDLSYFLAHHPEARKSQTSPWGLPDQYVYERAREFLQNNYAKECTGNFLLMIETLDTHLNDGYLLPGVKPRYHDIRDSFVQADKMAAAFVKWVKTQPFYKDTTIVIVGDHLIMTDKLGAAPLPHENQRSVYNVFINPVPALTPLQQRRKFSTYDLAPTFMESIGANLPRGRLGIGHSLFRPEATVYERVGFAYFDAELRKASAFYDRFYRRWD
jgi:phosphoglycerol transferase